jgi:hypothetical protein
MVNIAVQENCGVLEFYTDKVSLEEIFVQLTTQEPAQEYSKEAHHELA